MEIQTPNTEKDSKYWDAFALWWTPRNDGGQPDRNDAATWEKYQYYCAGVMDERDGTHSGVEDKIRMEWLLTNSCIKVNNLYYTTRESLDEAIRAAESANRPSSATWRGGKDSKCKVN